MGNKGSTKQEPVIMTNAFVDEKIVLDIAHMNDLNVSELQKLIKTDGIDSSLVLSLKLEQLNLLNISGLWRFSLLTKLHLANNFIEEIEGIEKLSNLQFLDLSFNYVKTMKGLAGLVNLKYLNLSSNEITILENMENIKNLESFLVRRNKIKSFDNVCYLTQFENLFCLGIGENPLSEEKNTRMRIIAILPQLKSLDFKIVTENELQEALSAFPSDNKFSDTSILNNDSSLANFSNDFSSSWNSGPSDKEAFVEGLANGRGFETFLKSDKNFYQLHSFPPASKIAEKKVSEVYDEWHLQGRKYYEQMQIEKMEFISMVKEVQKFTLSLMEEEEYQYITAKEEVPKELCVIFQRHVNAEQKDMDVEKLKQKCEEELVKTHRNLMNTTCMCIDLIYKLWNTFQDEIRKITENYLETVQSFYEKIMKVDEMYITQLKNFYSKMFATGTNYDLEVTNPDGRVIQLDPIFIKLLTKQSYVEMTLKMAVTIHSTLLRQRIKKLKAALENFRKDALTFEGEVLDKQNGNIRNIVIFCNKQQYIIDKFFSDSGMFKQYLRYR